MAYTINLKQKFDKLIFEKIWKIKKFDIPLSHLITKPKIKNMCIFSSDATVNATQIMAAVLKKTNLLAYSNDVKIPKGGSVMTLPIPTKSQIKFHDTTNYKDFLFNISNEIKRRESEGTRSTFTPKEFSTVGMYKMATVDQNNVISTLVDLKQPVQKWQYKMLEAYDGWKWLFVILPEAERISAQPLLVEFEQHINPGKLYFPLMDIHGDHEVESTAYRNHVLSIGDEKHTNPIQVQLDGFPWRNLKFDGFSVNQLTENGDMWASKKTTKDDPEHWKVEFENRYK